MPYCKIAEAHTNNRPLNTAEPEKLTRKFYNNNFCALLGNSAYFWRKKFWNNKNKTFFLLSLIIFFFTLLLNIMMKKRWTKWTKFTQVSDRKKKKLYLPMSNFWKYTQAPRFATFGTLSMLHSPKKFKFHNFAFFKLPKTDHYKPVNIGCQRVCKKTNVTPDMWHVTCDTGTMTHRVWW